MPKKVSGRRPDRGFAHNGLASVLLNRGSYVSPARRNRCNLDPLVFNPVVAGAVDVGFQYGLADFTARSLQRRPDRSGPARGEAYSVFANEIRVFNASGMETYGFTVDPAAVGRLLDLAVEDDGNLLLLIYGGQPGGTARVGRSSAPTIGPFAREVELDLSSAPEDSGRTAFSTVRVRSGSPALRPCTPCRSAGPARSRESSTWPRSRESPRGPAERRSRGVRRGSGGNVLFSVPVQFRVYVVASDGTTRSFGRSARPPETSETSPAWSPTVRDTFGSRTGFGEW